MASLPLLRLSLPPLHHPQATPLRRTRASTVMIRSSYSPTPATERLISAGSYFLPLINGIHYSRFLFQQFPPLSIPFQPLLPLISIYRSLPYASFISFFALYLGVARNPSFSRYARFNALQALLLDVLLVIPVLFQRIFTPGGSNIGVKFTVWTHNFVFVFLVSCFMYGLVASVLGKTPSLPFLAEAAGRQLE